MFICFDTEESSKQFLERSDLKSFKDNEMLVLSRYVVLLLGFNIYLQWTNGVFSIQAF